jgi:tRNA dimethylallyltransferase
MQHLLFPERLTSNNALVEKASPPSPALEIALSHVSDDLRALYDHLPDIPVPTADKPDAALQLHRLLSALDPDVAARWHWRDARKVLRSLIIIKESGRMNSDIIAEQSNIAVRPR